MMRQIDNPIMTLFLAVTLFAIGSRAQEGRSQGRSVVVSRYGIVAAESPLAAQAGATILARGGHAVDAAVAANAVMGLVAPHMNGMGGDLFAIVYEARSGKLYGLNASGWAPAGMTIEFLKQKGITEMPPAGIHTVTVPGAADGWDKLLSRFGRMKFAEVLAPAIHYAEEGFPVTEWSAAAWLGSEQAIRNDPNASRTFLPNGRPPQFGEIFKNPDLAWSLKQIAAGGRPAFYEGEIARRIVKTSEQHGGAMALADLAEFSSEWVDPISTTYRGWTVYEIPPSGQGIAALSMLNIVENFPLGKFGHNSADALHVMIEAKKLAYADVLRYVADPRFSKVPVAGILSKEYAKKRSQLIQMAKANCDVPSGQPPVPSGGDTTYLSVVDREGNMVSFIQSNFAGFGSGLVAEGTGFALQNRGNLFSLDPSHPNALAGRKRPLHTIIPGMMSKGDVRIAFGIMGGWNQSQAHAQFVSNLVDHGMNIQAALEAARFTKRTFEGCDVQMEARIAREVRDELSRRGHQISQLGIYSDIVGGGQAVMRDFSTKVNYGASDPRKDGAAIPEPPPEQKQSTR
ncbi:MAG: gamma-glutamyltransferase [Acidobacteria bacterium RIFCSPLOWO2_12_FULL_60_22]|nr:MAG: gamma-glutamyltransferase [Acidobacteria bacterium RIFCSPLOWO2_12_FULL_60_22]